MRLFRNRDYSVATFLTMVQFFGMFGFMLTTTIYMQSVLGMSAIQAGLTTLPLTLSIMVVSPLAGRFTDRIGGRYILMAGCLLFAAGIGGVAFVESLSSNSFTFVVPLALAGIGAGCMIAPIMTVAMQRIEPAMAGAASGLLNTGRQVGAAIGAAVLGAVLQNQLASAMHTAAVADSTQLPAQFRQRFVEGFANAASSGFEVGRGQSGGAAVPLGVPPQALQLVQQLIHDVFVNAFVTAMRPTLVVAVIAFLVGAMTTVLISQPHRQAASAAEVPEISVSRPAA
jgi:MFS family permease